jgi:DNA modification methylase
MKIKTDLYFGVCKEQLLNIPDNSVDLIVTSPPMLFSVKVLMAVFIPTLCGMVLPISEQLLRVLKPTGTFILNIKEKVVNGERSTYVMELIIEMRKQGWFWTEEFIGIKRIVIQANGQIVFVMHGSDFFS